jgi:hypothetical protein
MKTSDFDTSAFYEAAQLSPELEKDYAADMEDLRAAAQELAQVSSSLRHLRQEAHEAVLAHVQDYDRLVHELEARETEAKGVIKSFSVKYKPSGGIRFRFGDLLLGTKSTTETLAVDPRCLTPDWIEELSAIYVDGRPLLVPTLDTRLLQEAIRREILDREELEEAGILKVKRPTPAWVCTHVGSRDA